MKRPTKIRTVLSEFSTFLKSSNVAVIFATEIVFGLVVTIKVLLLFLILADNVIDRELIFFDAGISNFFYSIRSPQLTSFMKVITFYGGDVFIGTATIVTIALLLKKHKREAEIFFIVLVYGIILNLLLKHFFYRPRPHFDPLVFEATFSFPSGHAMNSLIFYGSLVFLILRNTRDKFYSFFLSILASILIVLIGISRIYLGAHYPSDVIAGYAAGMCWLVIVYVIERTIRFSKLFSVFEVQKKKALRQ